VHEVNCARCGHERVCGRFKLVEINPATAAEFVTLRVTLCNSCLSDLMRDATRSC
jgi:hypothetical protein